MFCTIWYMPDSLWYINMNNIIADLIISTSKAWFKPTDWFSKTFDCFARAYRTFSRPEPIMPA